MFEKSFLEEIELNLKKIKGDFKEVYFENINHFFCYFNKDWKFFANYINGIGLRIEKNGSTTFKKKQSSDLNKIAHFVKYFDDKESLINKDLIEKKFPLSSKRYVFDSTELKKFFYDLKSLIQEKEEDRTLLCNISLTGKDIAVVNSEGVLTNEERDYVTIYVRTKANKPYSSAESKILCGRHNFSQIDKEFESALEEALRISAFKKSAQSKVAGEMAVVFSSRAAGFLMNEALSHFFESDLEKKTNFSKYLGEKIAPEFVNIYDEGPLEGIAQYDDEGFQPPSPVALIEKGKVVNMLTNRNSAKTLSLKRTGNARRWSFRCQPTVGIWNIALKPSKYDEMELIENVDFGLYVKRIEDGYLSLKKGKFSFPVTESYIIRNGKICEGVKDIEVKGNTPQFLSDIKLIGDKGEIYGGIRKKGEQFYQTFENVPPILFKKFTVAPLK